MSDTTASTPTFHDLTSAQRTAICQAIGHLSACVEAGGPHAEREAKFVRDLVTAFGIDHLRDLTSACWAEVSA
jgi:hypothetical protein